MRSHLLIVGLVVGILATGAHTSAGQPVAPRTEDDCYRVESERFVFHSDPWINLHHFLFQWARDGAPHQPKDRRRAQEVPEKARHEDLSEDGRRIWERAAAHYREHLVSRYLLFDRDLIALRGQLEAIACSEAGPEAIDGEIQAVLTEAMSVYRRHWWPAHRAANLAWIREQRASLKTHEEHLLASRLAEIYSGEWPAERIRVDIAAYANWAGAYTTNHPDRVTIMSGDYKGIAGLEMIFHEVSHAAFFEQRVLAQVAAAYRPYETDPPWRLTHAIQFATPAELVRGLLSADERQDFRSVADAVHERGSFREQYQVVLEHWRPFLDGRIGRDEALARIAAQLTGAKAPSHPRSD